MQELQSCSEHAYSRNDENNNGLRNNFITWKKVEVVIVLISLMILSIRYLYFYHFGAKLVPKKFHTHV